MPPSLTPWNQANRGWEVEHDEREWADHYARLMRSRRQNFPITETAVAKFVEYVIVDDQVPPTHWPSLVMRRRLSWPEEVEELIGLNRRMFRYTSPDASTAARVSAIAAEAWIKGPAASARISDIGSEAWIYAQGAARVSLIGAEVWLTPVAGVSAANVSQVGSEAWITPTVNSARISNLAAEAWISIALTGDAMRVTTMATEVWATVTSASNQTRVTQMAAEAWITSATTPARVSQISAVAWVRVVPASLQGWSNRWLNTLRQPDPDDELPPRIQRRASPATVAAATPTAPAGLSRAVLNAYADAERAREEDEAQLAAMLRARLRYQPIYPAAPVPSVASPMLGVLLRQAAIDAETEALPITFGRGRRSFDNLETGYIPVSWVT